MGFKGLYEREHGIEDDRGERHKKLRGYVWEARVFGGIIFGVSVLGAIAAGWLMVAFVGRAWYLVFLVALTGAFLGPVVIMGALGAVPTLRDVHYLARRSRMRHRQCIVCGSSLKGREAADDGCVVCPECGAAWKLPMVDVSV